jgi:hypothetical protein
VGRQVHPFFSCASIELFLRTRFYSRYTTHKYSGQFTFREAQPVITITANVTSNEWMKLFRQAASSWPNERLSHAEILRRLALAGCEKVGRQTVDEAAAQGKKFREALDPAHPEFRGVLPVKT